MTNNKQQRFLTAVIVLVLFASFGDFGYGRLTINHSSIAYEESETLVATGLKTYSIENYVELGAAYYLESESGIKKLLKMVELLDVEGANLLEMDQVVDTALANMKLAVNTYEHLIAKAETTPYNAVILSRLKEFDYNRFGLKFGLNQTSLNRVASFLQNGNITGIYKHCHAVFLKIISLLSTIKSDINQNNFDRLDLFWDLNETCADLTQFASYTARIFYRL